MAAVAGAVPAVEQGEEWNDTLDTPDVEWLGSLSLFCPYGDTIQVWKFTSLYQHLNFALTSSCKFCSLNDAYLSKHESAILGWPLWLTTSSLVRQT